MKKNLFKVIGIIEKICLLTAVIAAVVGSSMFVYLNQELFNNIYLVIGAFSVMLLIMILSFIFYIIKSKENTKKIKIINLLSGIITGGIGLYICLTQLILDYFQPLSLFLPPIICLVLFLVMYVLSSILDCFSKKSSPLMSIIGVAMLGLFIVTTCWANFQDYAKFNPNVESKTVFEKGEDNYSTYRIPTLLLIEQGEKQKENTDDILIVFAEARKNTNLDYSISELVYKTSFDAGETWSEKKVGITPTELLGSEGRIADPTPVYNKNTDKICLLFQAATEESGYKMATYYSEGQLENDGTIVWDKDSIINVTDYFGKHFGPGPSKGTQLSDGSLAFPIRSEGQNYIITTNDSGKTWKKGDSAGVGGETDFASINDNEIVLIGRNGKMSELPRNNHLRFAFSSNNGKTWDTQTTDSSLRTPVVMSSVSSYNGDIYCAHDDTYLSRANLSYSVSKDKGKTWKTTQLYSGASGYAIGDITSDGNYYIIAEIGKVEYNEEIRLFTIPLNN